VADERVKALSEVLDRLEATAHGDSVTVQDVVEKLEHHSFAALMLIVSLIAASPASAIPGITVMVGVIVFLLVLEMILGRSCIWLPQCVMRRRMSTHNLCKGIGWLRKPVKRVERLSKTRLIFLLHRPWLFVPLILVAGLALFMPFMEVVPTSGSVASAVIALFAAGLLLRDGALVVVSCLLLAALPAAIWYFGMRG
jgi:hypothetical protein